MDNACIIGYGIVGRATALQFGITRHIDVSDNNISLEDAAKCRYVFLCLPTPTNNGKQDAEIIEAYIKKIVGLSSVGRTPLFIIRSTVIPGTARRIMEAVGISSVVSNPEFLTESKWESDAKHPSIVVIGSDNPQHGDALAGVYESRWKGIQLYRTDTITAETTKYALNTFFATKVIFANRLFDICQDIKANYETIRQVLEFYPEGSKNHFTIWHKGGRGAGGRCLSKDLDAFSSHFGDEFFLKVLQLNKELLEKYPKTT